jgi:uncharacterized protein YodC (DUF2158 family)
MTVSDPTGYVVRLASGGPPMIVEGFNIDKKTADVAWVDRLGRIHHATFPEVCLRIVKARPA